MTTKHTSRVEVPHATRKGARRTNQFIYLVLGVFVLGVLPAPAGLILDAQAQKTSSAGAPSANGGPGAKKTVKVNAGSFRGFLTRSKKLKDDGKLDLSRPREITVEVDRSEDGAISNALFTGEASSDPQLKKVALDFVSTLNESRALHFLEGVSRVRMNFALDGERFKLLSHSEAPTEARAEEMARGYRSMLNLARLFRRGGDEAVVLNNMKISASGKHLVMSLDTPREAMGNLLLKQITPN